MTSADNTAQRSGAVREGLLARHPLVFYFLIAFVFSWLMFLPGPLTYFGVLDLSDSVLLVLGITGLLGPILSGFLMTAVTEGGPGIRRWLRRIVLWRVGIRWYLFALIGLPWLWCSARSSARGPWNRSKPLLLCPCCPI